MKHFDALSDGATTEALIAFADLTRFAEVVRGESLAGVAALIRTLAETSAEAIEPTSGQIIKYIGDAVFAAFPAAAADEGVRALLGLRRRLLDRLGGRGMGVTLTAHVGEVVVAKMKPFTTVDIFGEAVNITFTMDRRSHRGRLVISADAFRRLAPATRRLFRRHTPPIVYVGDEAAG
jgi:class 3 adenylate cyclase